MNADVKPLGIFAAALALFFCGPPSAVAAVFDVPNGNIGQLKLFLNTANSNSEDDTINLAAGGTYTLTTVDNGANGLPLIRYDNGHSLTINGNGATIIRSEAGGTPNFRILEIGGFANAILNQVIVRNGRTGGDNPGGGIHVDNGTLTLINCTIRNNSTSESQQSSFAVALGGGIWNDDGVVVLQNCTLTANSVFASSGNGSSAIASGGAIYNTNGIVMLQNCTVSGNATSANSTAMFPSFGLPDAAGGAISNGASASGYASVTLSSCTFSSNGSSNSGGAGFLPSNGIENNGSTAVITFGNTILVGTGLSNFQGMIVSNGYNLSSDNAAGFFTGTGDQINTNPQLGPLSNNGGLTDTHPLFQGSPAIDKGKRDAVPSLATNFDQRGVPRPVDFPDVLPAPGGDSSDIGAFELVFQPFIVTTTADHDDGTCDVIDCTFREAILAANARTGPDTILFASGVTGTVNLVAGLPTLSTDLKISGPGANLLTVRRDTGGNYRLFFVSNFSNGVTPGPQVTIAGLTLANGVGIGSGAAGGCIDNDFATLRIERCAIVGNNAGIGAGVFNFRGAVTVIESTISGNTSTGSGGAFYNSAAQGPASLTLINSTVSGNLASGGAAIHNPGTNGAASVTLQNCTLAGNSATGGGITNNGGSATLVLQNTILSAGASGANIVNTNGAIVASEGRNLSSDAAGGDGTTGPGGLLNHAGDIRNTNPQLGVLQNNGGPTFTHALLSGSPAINSGDDALAPGTDQRGYLRSSVSDRGAFEFNGIELLGAVSRKLHGGVPFDVALPLGGNVGVECRSGGATGDHQMVLTFSGPVPSGSSQAQVVFGTATIGSGGVSNGGAVAVNGGTVTIPLTGVANAERIQVRLSLVNGTANFIVPMGVLFGDANGDTVVNSGDAQQTRNRSGQGTDATNFRSDYNLDAVINAADATIVRARSGNFIP